MVHGFLALLFLALVVTPSGAVDVYASDTAWEGFSREASATPQYNHPVDSGQSPPSLSKNPDLIINEITFSPENPTLGNRLTFTVLVENIGDGLAASSKMDCYIDNDYVSSGIVRSLESGASLGMIITWTARAGDHTIRAVADSEQGVPESDETNNELTLAFSVLAPNLVISNIAWLPENPSVQDKVTFTATIKNAGSNIAGNSYLDFFIDGVSRGYREVPRLDAGATFAVSFSWNAQAGSHEIKAVADVLNQAAESDEADNTRTVVYSTLAPDLIIQTITLSPAYPSPGDNVTFAVTIKNAGKGKSYASHVAYYIDSGVLASDYISPMNAGATVQKTFSWIAEPGAQAITAVADAGEENAESDETNNTKTVSLSKGAPDLVVHTITWSPSSPSRDQDVIFTVMVKNQGHAASGLSVLYFYIDSSCYSTLVEGISADNTTAKSFPWAATEGAHTLRAIADAENYVTEDNESNNEKTATIAPSPPIPSDLMVQNIVCSPEKPVVGDAVTITARVNNIGSGQAGWSSVVFYIDGSYLATSSIGPLNSGATTVVNVAWRAQPGSHTIKAIADSNQILPEKSEDNNTYSAKVLVAAPDLSVSAISWTPVNPSPGDTVTFTLHISNRGSYKANHSLVGYYISDSPVGNHYVEGLETGDTVTRTFTLVAPVGTYIFKATADMDNEVPELNESNNDKTVSLPFPDLTVEAITWLPENPVQDEAATFSITVRNQGGDTVRNFDVIFYMDGHLQSRSAVDSLKSGATVTKIFALTSPVGSHVIRTTVDEANNIVESDEANNEKTVAISVSEPPVVCSPTSQSPLPTLLPAQTLQSEETVIGFSQDSQSLSGVDDDEPTAISQASAAPAITLLAPADITGQSPPDDNAHFNWWLIIGVVSGTIIIGVATPLVLMRRKPQRAHTLATSQVEH